MIINILKKGTVALVMGMVAAGCSHDLGEISEYEAAMDNAQATLGFYIPADQDWVMSSWANANLPIEGLSGESYIVKVYSNNPMADSIAYILDMKTVEAGQNYVSEFRYPAAMTSFYVGLTDDYGRTTYKRAPIVNGVINFFEEQTAATRSQTAPEVQVLTQPYDETWVANYNSTAKEPTTANTIDNFDNTRYETDWSVVNAVPSDDPDKIYFTQNTDNLTWDALVAWALENHPTWVKYVVDEDFVLNFKITGTRDGYINVASSEGYTTSTDPVTGQTIYGERQDPYCARTIVVTGTWNINDQDQRIGSGGQIIIANGGTVNVAEGKTLQMVNHARLIVLPGGTLTGKGAVEVSNGNGAGEENYNGGTISVARFNNNFGKFYNYGKFLVNEYWGGAQESNFYNHSLVVIDHFGGTGSTANARVFNHCQFYVKNNARIRNYEGIQGSALIVGGELLLSSSEDGTTTPTYVGLAAGALIKCGTLYNNGTSWTGPTSGGYGALEIVNQITYMNWEQDHPDQGGYFENNIYVKAGTWANVPDGNGMQQKTDNGTEYYTMSQAEYKFWQIVANCRGNNGVTKVSESTNILIDADGDFVLGENGCTPGFTGTTTTPDTPPSTEEKEQKQIWSYAFEDSNLKSDYDLNDVVIKVQETMDGTQLKVMLVAAGCEYDNEVYLDDTKISWNGKTEVHDVLNASHGMTVNTGWHSGLKMVYTYITKPTNYDPQTANWSIVPSSGDKANEHIGLATTGSFPTGIVIPYDWAWPIERTNICDAYTGFSTWATTTVGDLRTSTSSWYESPTSGLTMK